MKRREVVYNDGVPSYGDLAVWKSFDASVAPNNPSEPLQVGRNAVISGYTIYVESGVPTGILATDVVSVRGVDMEVDGEVAPWWDYFGEYVGDQFAVKGAVG